MNLEGLVVGIFAALFLLLGVFVYKKYKQSRNKHLFFDQTIFKVLIVNLLLLFSCLLFCNIFFDDTPFSLKIFNISLISMDQVRAYLESDQLFWYYTYKALYVLTNINLVGALGALLILINWYIYIRKLDFFSTEKTSITLLILLVAMASTLLTFPLSDWVNGSLHIQYEGNWLYKLFVASALGIGLVEETIKLLPVVVVIVCTKEVDEPFDLIYYACISALGFGFIENLLYLKDLAGLTVTGRGVTSAVGHMVFASLCIYGVVLYRYRPGFKQWWRIPVFILIGSFAHGLFDFLLFEGQWMLFYLSFVVMIQIWLLLINNAINNSPHFDFRVLYEHEKHKLYLSIGLVIIFLGGYTINVVQLGTSVANRSFFTSLLFNGILILFYISSFSNLDLFQGHWRKIHFNWKGLKFVPQFLTNNYIIPQNHVLKRLVIYPAEENLKFKSLMIESKGHIKNRIKVVTLDGEVDIDWFLVRLANPLLQNVTYDVHHVLIKFVNPSDSFLHENEVHCSTLLLLKDSIPTNKINMSDCRPMGKSMVLGKGY